MKRSFSLFMAVALLAFLPSCAPFREIKELAIVEGLAIDKTDGGFHLTFQIFNPKSSGGQQEQNGGKSSEENIVDGYGSSVFDAIRNTTLTIGKKLYFQNTRLYVISEDICKDNFYSILDFFERPVEIRPSERIIISKGKAADILTAKKNGKTISALDFATVLDNYKVSSKIVDFDIETVSEKHSSGITDLSLAAVKDSKSEQGESTLVMDGTAVMKKNKLAGYLDDIETRGLLWTYGKVKSGIIMVYPPAGGSVSLEISKSSSKIITKVVNGKPAIEIDLMVASDISEKENTNISVLNPEQIKELEELQKKAVTQEVNSAIDKAMRQYDADIFGFGMHFFEYQPEEWRRISGSWDQQMKTLPVAIKVESKIQHVGTIMQ